MSGYWPSSLFMFLWTKTKFHTHSTFVRPDTFFLLNIPFLDTERKKRLIMIIQCNHYKYFFIEHYLPDLRINSKALFPFVIFISSNPNLRHDHGRERG